MKRVRSVESALSVPCHNGLSIIPDEVVASIINYAYKRMHTEKQQLIKVCRLRETCTKLQRAIDQHLFASMDTVPSLCWHLLLDNEIYLFPALRRITLNEGYGERKRGATILKHMTKTKTIAIGARISEDFSVGLKDEMTIDVLFEGLSHLKTVAFTCTNVPVSVIEKAPQRINSMLFWSIPLMCDKHIASMQNLRHLTLQNCAFSRNFDSRVFHALVNLESLSVHEIFIQDANRMYTIPEPIVRQMTNLRRLSLANTDVLSAHSLPLLTQLETLSLQLTGGPHCHLCDITSDSIATMTNLVDVSFNGISGLTLGCLKASAKTLQRLVYVPKWICRFLGTMSFDHVVDTLALEFPLLVNIQIDKCLSSQMNPFSFFMTLEERVIQKRRLLLDQ